MNVLIFIVKADLNSEQQPISLVIPDDTNNLDKTKIQTVNNSQLVYIYPWHKLPRQYKDTNSEQQA